VHPILFRIPGVDWPIHSFGAMFALAFFVGAHLMELLARRYGDDPENDPKRMASIALWVLLGIVAGGRLLYVIVHPDEFTRDETGRVLSGPEVIGRTVAIWKGGLVFYGGLIAAFVVGIWRVRRYGMRLWHVADLTMIAGFVGLGIGRIGCLLVGDDHGRVAPASAPFPIAFTVPKPLPDGSFFDPSLAGERVYATQIWMMANGFALAALGWWILRRRSFPGQVTFTITAVYAFTRGFIEYFRGDDAARGFTDVALFGTTVRLYTSVKIGLALVPISIAMLLILRARARRGAPSTA